MVQIHTQKEGTTKKIQNSKLDGLEIPWQCRKQKYVPTIAHFPVRKQNCNYYYLSESIKVDNLRHDLQIFTV